MRTNYRPRRRSQIEFSIDDAIQTPENLGRARGANAFARGNRDCLLAERSEPVAHSFDGLFDVWYRVGVAEPQESFSMFSKRGGWKERHTGLFEQGLGDLGAASAKR